MIQRLLHKVIHCGGFLFGYLPYYLSFITNLPICEKYKKSITTWRSVKHKKCNCCSSLFFFLKKHNGSLEQSSISELLLLIKWNFFFRIKIVATRRFHIPICKHTLLNLAIFFFLFVSFKWGSDWQILWAIGHVPFR